MKRTSTPIIVLTAAVATVLSACGSTPDKGIPELESARAVVPQVEASPRAGVAATNIAEARKSLDRANKLASGGGDTDDVRFEAMVATRNAEIANEKILTAQAKDELAQGEAERAKALLDARNNEANRAKMQTEEAAREAELARQRADSLEQELK